MANLDWMYKRPMVDAEAYLTGKPIDKSLELLEHPDGVPTNSEDIGRKPGALFLEAAASAALEAEAKLREDPLYAIKKKEEEQRRALLNNPVRLKMMQEELEKKERLKKKKKNKDVREDDLILKMLRLKEKFGTDLKDLLTEGEQTRHTSSKNYQRSSSPRYSDSSKKNAPPTFSTNRPKSQFRERKRSRSRSSDRSSRVHSQRDEYRQRDRSRSPVIQKNKPLVDFSRVPSRVATSSNYIPASNRSHKVPPKMDQEEIDRRRREMMDNAKSRDMERSANVAMYHRRDAVEDVKNKDSASGKAGGFIRPLLVKANDTDTLQSRIHSNRNKLQRTSAALDKNFTRR